MATELQAAYQQLRDAGYGHQEALRALATRLDVDTYTVRRALARANEPYRRKVA